MSTRLSLLLALSLSQTQGDFRFFEDFGILAPPQSDNLGNMPGHGAVSTYHLLKHHDSPLKRLAQLRQRSSRPDTINLNRTRKQFSGGATSQASIKHRNQSSHSTSKVCPRWSAPTPVHTYRRRPRHQPSSTKQQRSIVRLTKGSIKHSGPELNYMGLNHIKDHPSSQWVSKLRHQPIRSTLERRTKVSRQQKCSLTVQVKR